jgi:hypothetical protein
LRLQPVGVEEHRVQDREVTFAYEAVDRELVPARRGVGEIRPHDDPLHFRRGEERRIVERVLVLQELLAGGGQVGEPALALPGEAAQLPDVGPALAHSVRSTRRRPAMNSVTVMPAGLQHRTQALNRIAAGHDRSTQPCHSFMMTS